MVYGSIITPLWLSSFLLHKIIRWVNGHLKVHLKKIQNPTETTLEPIYLEFHLTTFYFGVGHSTCVYPSGYAHCSCIMNFKHRRQIKCQIQRRWTSNEVRMFPENVFATLRVGKSWYKSWHVFDMLLIDVQNEKNTRTTIINSRQLIGYLKVFMCNNASVKCNNAQWPSDYEFFLCCGTLRICGFWISSSLNCVFMTWNEKKMPSLLLVDKMWWNRTPCIAYVCSVQWKLCSTICVNACVDNQPSIRNIRSASGRTHLQFYQTINQKVHTMLFNWVFPMILSHQSRHSAVNFFQCNRNISKIYY